MPRWKTNYKAAVVSLRLAEPSLSYEEIAKRVGCSYSSVKYYCSMGGVPKGPTPNRWKEKYFVMREQHPEWTIYRIAQELGCRPSTLYGLKLRSDPDYANVMALGRAAVAAGLTLKQIEGMAHARHA